MKLGGGLGKAIVKPASSKTATSHRRSDTPRNWTRMHGAADGSPIALVALSLDHTGFNIGNLGAHVGAR
jgi:hypothetical protein